MVTSNTDHIPNLDPRAQFGACCYIDILGTSDRYAAMSEGDRSRYVSLYEEHGKRRELLMALSERFSAEFNLELKLNMFSDSIFISSAIKEPYYHLVTDAICAISCVSACYQATLLGSGVLCRGGLACGVLLIDENALIGLPVSNAVYVEEHLSQVPCTFLDSSAETAICITHQINRTTETAKRYIDGDIFLIDQRGQLFVNPFSQTLLESQHDHIDSLGKVLSTNLSIHQSNQKVRDRISWMLDLLTYAGSWRPKLMLRYLPPMTYHLQQFGRFSESIESRLKEIQSRSPYAEPAKE